MKKIIFFANDMNIGGMEKALLLLLNCLAEKYEIFLVLEKKRGDLLSQLDQRVHVSEYKVSELKFTPVRKVINFLHRFFWIVLHKNRYDFSCSYATYSVIGSRLALAASNNAALYVHSNYYDYFKGNENKIREFFQKLNSDKFQHILFVSNESKERLEKVFPYIKKRGKVINNLVDYKRIAELANESCEIKKDVNKTVFLFVGRLEEESKRLSRLFKSFYIAYGKKQEIELWIVGDGKDFSLCKSLVKKYNLEDCVKMYGKKVNPYPYMKAADCIILTSDFEGYPVIYNECMVLQKPFITTIPVSDQYIDIKEYAQLVDKDCEKIAKAILEFEHSNYPKVDFYKINEKRIADLKESINGK